MPVTSITATITPTITETVVASLVGGPFDRVSVFVTGGASPLGDGLLVYKLYSLTASLLVLVAESRAIGSSSASVLEWQSVGTGDASSVFVKAGASSYVLTAQALPVAPTGSQGRGPLTATLAGVDTYNVAASSSSSPILAIPPDFEVLTPNILGYSQEMDVSITPAVLLQQTSPATRGVIVTVYANNGPGSVEVPLAIQTILPPDIGQEGAPLVIAGMRALVLPVASTYRVGVKNNNANGTTAISVPIGVATYSVLGGTAGELLTPLVGSIGVTGPSNANLIAPIAPLEGENLLSLGAPPLEAAAWESATGPGAGGVFNPYWDQATWFVDPQNVSGVASDLNSGIDALHPVLSYNGGIATKWGTYSPRLRQDVHITWLSSQLTPGDPVILTPVMDATPPGFQGGTIYLLGVLGAAQQLHAGLLAAVIPKNRPAAQLLTADLGATLPVGTLLQNTTNPSFAWIYQHVSGTTYLISQPLNPAVEPLDLFNSVEVDTWANGDSFFAWAPITINAVKFIPTIATYNFAVGFVGQVQAYNLVFGSFTNSHKEGLAIQNDTTIMQCRFGRLIDNNTQDDVVTTGFGNCFSNAGFASSNASDIFSLWLGGVLVNGITSGFCFDLDAIVNCGTGMIFVSPFTDQDDTENDIGALYIDGKSIWSGTWNFTDGFFLPCTVWGPGLFEAQGAGTRIFYAPGAGSATTTFLNTGGLRVDDQTVASTFNTTTNLWSGPFLLTAANLDNPVVFNGLALNVGGASFSNQGTP